MAGILEYSSTPASNTTINGIGISGGSSVKYGDDAIRQFMADVRSAVTKASDKAAGTHMATKADHNQLWRVTGTATINLTSAATLTAGWALWVMADGGTVTIDPASSEQINGAATLTIQDGAAAFIVCTATAFRALPIGTGDMQAATVAQAWAQSPTPPDGAGTESAKTAADRATTQAAIATTQAGISTAQAGVSLSQANRSEGEADRAELARDAAEDAVQYTYLVADDTALAAIVGMTAGQRAFVRSTEHVWHYSGTAWVDDGQAPTAAKADKSVVDPLVPLVGTASVGVYRKNLFDIATMTDNSLISNTTGTLGAGAQYYTSDFIPVKPGAAYTVQSRSSLVFFNASKTFLSGSNTIERPSTFTAPSGAAFMRISADKTHVAATNYMVVAGSSLPAGYVAFDDVIDGRKFMAETVSADALANGSVTGAKTDFLQLGKNLFDKTRVTSGTVSATGTVSTPSATYSFSDYIPVQEGVAYHGEGSNQMRMWCFYSDIDVPLTGGSNADGTDFTAPAGCKFVRITIYTASLNTFQLEQGASKTTYENFGYELSAGVRLNAEVMSQYYDKDSDTLDALAEGTVNKNFTLTHRSKLERLASTLFGAFSPIKARVLANVADVTIMVLGDSTGNDDTDWPKPWSQWLAGLYPTHTVLYYLWNEAGGDYAAPVTLQTGSGARTIRIYNGSQSGAGPNYFFGSYFAKGIGSVTPDLVIWNYGHNVSPLSVPITRGQFLQATEWVKRIYPAAQHAFTMQNPRRDDAGSDAQIAAAQAIATQYDDSVLNVYERFIMAGKPASWYADNIHPNATPGQVMWTDVVKTAWDNAIPSAVAANPAFTGTGALNLLNLDANGVDQGYGYFKDYVSGTPAGWTLNNGATASKELAIVDTEMGDTFSIKLDGTAALAGMSRTLSPIALSLLKEAGTGTLAIRKYVPVGMSDNAGRCFSRQDGPGAVSVMTQPDAYRKGKWVWEMVSDQNVASTLTFGSVALYTDTAAVASTIYIGRVVFVAGSVPRDDQTAP